MDKQYTNNDDAKTQVLNQTKQFLEDVMVYECLPQNSQVILYDQDFSCFDAFHVKLQNDAEEGIVWNSEVANYEQLLTFTGVIQIILSCIQEQFAEQTQQVLIENNMDIENESISLSISQASNFKKIEIDVTLIKDHENFKQNLIQKLKKLTLKNWIDSQAEMGLQLKRILSVELDKNLYDASMQMHKHLFHRIMVINKESNLIVGSLTYKDILLFIIRNFSTDKENIFNISINNFANGLSENVKSVSKYSTVFNAFDFMIINNLSSAPIVNENNQFMGIIQMSDVRFILTEDNYEIFFKSNEWFLEYLVSEKKKYKACEQLVSQFYQPQDSLQDIVEKLVFAPGNRIFYLDSNNEMKGIITLTDLFDIYLDSFLEND